MHIVQILPELNQGGIERGVVEINREFVARGHRSTVVSAGGSLVAAIERDGGEHIRLDVCSKNPLSVPSRVRGLRHVLRGLEPDILHVRSRVPAWLAWLANKRLGIPFVTTVHGFNSVGRYSRIMTRGDRVIYVSSAIRDYILANYPVEQSRLRYVPRGVDLEHFDPAKADAAFVRSFREEHGLEGRTVVSTVGRITELKGIDDFIRALAEVRRARADVVGLVVGGARRDKREYFQSLEQMARDLGVEVRFAGPQSRVREIYALSDLLVSATSFKPEAFGRTIAEALAMETPVVASAHGGALDIVRDGANGLLFTPQDSSELAERILQALETPFSNLRKHIRENFSLERMAEAELAVYGELLAGG